MKQANVPFEIELKEKYLPYSNALIGSKKILIFQRGNKSYFRFSGSKGNYKFQTNKEQGSFTIGEYKGKNLLFKNGPIQISQDKNYLLYQNGTPFFYLADTIWFGMTGRISLKAFRNYLKLRKSQGFSAIQVVIGIPPEVRMDSADACNEGGPPFINGELNTSYFDAVDKRVGAIVESGMVPVIFGGWGHHIDSLGVTLTKKFWDEIMGRYVAYPVIFSLTGEADVFLEGFPDPSIRKRTYLLPLIPSKIFHIAQRVKHSFFGKGGNKRMLESRIKKWEEVGGHVVMQNSFNRPLTIHLSQKKASKEVFAGKFLTINSIQSGHSHDSHNFMENTISNAKKPIINLEPWYEGILGNFSAKYQRLAFWTCLLSGAKGHTYGAHGIWQVEKKDNFMNHWGKSDFKKSLSFEGGIQLGKSKEFLEKFEWEKMENIKRKVASKSNNKSSYFAAEINNSAIFIYFFKAKGSFKVNLDLSGYTLDWLNPVDFSLILKENTDHRQEFLIPKVATDILAVFTKK